MIYEVLGWVGIVLVLLAFILVETQKIAPKSKEYQLLNIFGASGILVNAVIHQAIPIVGLNIVWLLIALYELAKRAKR